MNFVINEIELLKFEWSNY